MPGDSVQLVLHPVAAPEGWADFTVLLTEVDGQPDERSANNTRSERSLRMSNAVDIVVSFTTDCFASQHGWVLRDPLDRVLHRSGWLPPSATSVDTLCVPADACLEFEVHRDQLSGYESLMADCLSPLTFSLWEVGSDAPFLAAPQSGVVDRYTLCTDNLTSGGCTDPYADNYDVQAVFDDGTCEPVCYPLTLSMDAGCAPHETGWNLHPDGLNIAPGGVQPGSAVWNLCLEEGCREFVLVDLAADGWDSSCGATHLTLSVGDDTLYHVVTRILERHPRGALLPRTDLVGCMELQLATSTRKQTDRPCDYSCWVHFHRMHYEPEATRNDASRIEASGARIPRRATSTCSPCATTAVASSRRKAWIAMAGVLDMTSMAMASVTAMNSLRSQTPPRQALLKTTKVAFSLWRHGRTPMATVLGMHPKGCPTVLKPPPGWVAIPGDCNDASASFYPGAPFAPLGGVNCDGFVSASELAPCASDLNQDGLTAIDDLLDRSVNGTIDWNKTSTATHRDQRGPVDFVGGIRHRMHDDRLLAEFHGMSDAIRQLSPKACGAALLTSMPSSRLRQGTGRAPHHRFGPSCRIGGRFRPCGERPCASLPPGHGGPEDRHPSQPRGHGPPEEQRHRL